MARCLPLQLLALSALLASCAGQDDMLECYSCALTDGDDSCLNDPDNAGISPIVECTLEPDKCCLIQRVDDNENLGTPLSFARLCTKNCDPDKLGQMIETPDFSYTTYQTYCNEPRCNDGPGNVPLGQGSGGGEIICCIDGIEGAATTATFTVMTLVALLLLVALDPRGR